MIIEGLLTVIYNLLELLMTPIEIPELPAEAASVMSAAAVKLSEGAGTGGAPPAQTARLYTLSIRSLLYGSSCSRSSRTRYNSA